MEEQISQNQQSIPTNTPGSVKLDLKFILISLLVLFLVGLTSFWFGKQQSYKVEVPYAPLESPTKVLNPTQQQLVKEKEQSRIDNYAWVEFKNPQTKYTFKYPSSWTFSKGEGCVGLLKPPDNNNFWICFGTAYEEMNSLVERINDRLKPTSREDILVGDKPAIRLNNMDTGRRGQTSVSDEGLTSLYVGDVNYQGAEGFPEKKVTLTINYFHLTEEDRTSYDDIFNQILSTITFE